MPTAKFHFPEKIPPTEKKLSPTKRCIYCWNKGDLRKETSFVCGFCEGKPALCMDECFLFNHIGFGVCIEDADVCV